MKRITLSLLLFITVISAQWSTDPATPQSLGNGIKAQLAATSDGGVYVAWLSDGNNYHVYLQRLNSSGEPQWAENGMVVSENVNASWIAVYHLNLAVDSEDNAIITTVDQRTGGQWEVYAYKVDPDGSMLWGDDGLALTDSGVSNMSPRLIVLSDNSVVVTWTHNDNTVLFQRISSAGTLLWGTGIHIEDDNATLLSPQPIVTAEDDILIQWIRQTGPFWAANSELYLQKYDYGGNPQWINPIVAAGPVVFPMGNWSQQSVAATDSGSFSAWTEMSGNVQSAGVQHITGEGALSWIGGVDLSTNSSNFHISPQLTIANDTQELMAIWKEKTGSQTQIGVYAQRLDSGGNRLWGANGTAVVELNSSYDYLDLSVAGFEEDLIAAYIEQSVNMNGDIYAARLDADGNSVWMGESITVTNSSNPKSDMMIAKGPGCFFIAWTEGGSVYTHCLREDGTLGAPGGILLVPAEYVTIEEAIDAASDGDMVLVSDGTYTGAGNKELTWDGTEKHIVVKSANGPENCIIDLENSGRAFSFVSGSGNNSIWITAADVIDGFTIRNGNSSNYGGAIYCYYGYQNDVSPTIRNCIFENNTSNYGGAICIDGGSSLITNCVFDSNSANYGGAIYLGSAGGDTEPLIQQCTFKGNSADLHWNGQGGAIYLTNVSTNEDCRIWNNTFDGNSAPNGGAIYFSTSSPEVSGNLFINNTGSTNASALYIYNYDGPTISNCTIANNFGAEAVYCYGFNGTVEPVFINTIIWGSDSSFGFQDTSQANPIISYCNIESGFPITGTDGGGNISVDPSYCNPDSGDFTLAENSPCVGTGEDGANMGAFGVGCGIQVDWDFSLSEPVIEVMGTDNIWNPGDTISVEMDFCNNTDVAHNWYPGVTIESDSSLTSLHVGHIWFYAMFADQCHAISWSTIADTSIISDTIVTFRAYPEALNCQNQPEYCIDGDTLTFEVPIVVQDNFPPSDFSLLTPENGDTVYINLSNQNDSLLFQWEESIDPDGDSIQYIFGIIIVGGFGAPTFTLMYEDTLEQTHLSLSNIFIADSIAEIEEPDDTNDLISCIWYVNAFDGLELNEKHHGLALDFSGYLELYNEVLPRDFVVYPAFPNPFNPVTTLRYDIPEKAMINITIYDMLGKQVKTLINQTQDAGYRSVIWDATNDYGKPASAGIYLYQIQAGEYMQTKKMLLLK